MKKRERNLLKAMDEHKQHMRHYYTDLEYDIQKLRDSKVGDVFYGLIRRSGAELEHENLEGANRVAYNWDSIVYYYKITITKLQEGAFGIVPFGYCDLIPRDEIEFSNPSDECFNPNFLPSIRRRKTI